VISIFSILFITTVSYKVVLHYNEHISFISKEIEGTKSLRYAKALLMQTQKLRNFTYLNRSDALKKSYYYKLVKQNFMQLSYLMESKSFKESALHLKNIERQLATITSLLKSHSTLNITKMLDTVVNDELRLITSIANDSNLILDPKLNTYYLMDSLVNTIPQFLESLAETKAFYYTYTAQRQNNDILMRDIGKLIDSKYKLFTSLHYIREYNPKKTSILSKNIFQLNNTINKFLLLVKKHHTYKNPDQMIIQQENNILNIIDKIYDTNTNMLIRLLHKREREYTLEKDAIIFSAILFLSSVIFLIYLLFRHDSIALKNQFLAYHDQLTSLGNKYAFDRDLQELSPSSALLIDIKQFSLVNDLYGEGIGDTILHQFARILLDINKIYNCNIYRIGSDQFMILNINEDTYHCHRMAKNIFKHFNNNAIDIKTEEQHISILIKIRIAKIDITADDKLLCKTRADIALNYAKKKHKDYITYDSTLHIEEKIKQELETLEMVKDAILDNRVIPVFQKIQKEHTNSYESLVRIQDREEPLKLIPPARFLETIYNTPYYAQITKIMIKKSFDTFSHRDENFSINFSFEDITNKSTVRYLVNMIEKYNMHGRVIIELLETEAMQNITTVRHFIQKMRSYGVQIAIDDFGSGYSNFIYLAQLEPDFIKIDGSIIKNIDKDKKSYIIAKHINEFAKEIGCRTIAEFVHSKEISRKVKELQINGQQGYFIQKPLEEFKLS
jgi:diguanylate cyclase (GGDEF)-like protein